MKAIHIIWTEKYKYAPFHSGTTFYDEFISFIHEHYKTNPNIVWQNLPLHSTIGHYYLLSLIHIFLH